MIAPQSDKGENLLRPTKSRICSFPSRIQTKFTEIRSTNVVRRSKGSIYQSTIDTKTLKKKKKSKAPNRFILLYMFHNHCMTIKNRIRKKQNKQETGARKHKPKVKPRVLMRALLQMTMETEETTDNISAPTVPSWNPAPPSLI